MSECIGIPNKRLSECIYTIQGKKSINGKTSGKRHIFVQSQNHSYDLSHDNADFIPFRAFTDYKIKRLGLGFGFSFKSIT